MRIAFALALGCLCALAAASPTGSHDATHQWKIKICKWFLQQTLQYNINWISFSIADKQQLQKQLDILRLFRYISQPSYYKDFEEIAKTYSIEKNIDGYTVSCNLKYYNKKFQFFFY